MAKLVFEQPKEPVGDLLAKNLGDSYIGASTAKIRGWSSISNYMTCDRMFYYKTVKKFKSPNTSDALDIGILIHECLAAHYQTGGQRTFEPLQAVQESRPEIATEVKRLLYAYFARYIKEDVDTWDVRAVETEIIGDVAYNNYVAKVYSRLDLLVRVKGKDDPVKPYGPCEDGVYIVDHKCATGSTKVITPDRRERLDTLYDLHRAGLKLKILAYNDTTKQFEFNTVTNFWKTEPKKIVELKTKFGRTVKLSADHPVLTRSGFKPAKEILCGEDVAITGDTSNMVDTLKSDVSDDYVKFIGAWIADGSKNKDDGSLEINKYDTKHMQCVLNAAHHEFNIDYKFIVDSSNNKKLIVRVPKNKIPDRFYTDVCIAKSPDRYLNERMLMLPQKQLRHLVGMLWSGDGAAYSINELTRSGKTNKKIRICYTTRSFKLADQVSFMLTRLGLLNSIQATSVLYNGERIPYAQVTIVGSQSKLKFLAHVADNVINCPRLQKDCEALFAIQQGKVLVGKNPKLEGALYWDSIKSNIQLTEEEACYDLTIEPTHTFVADNFVTHNCMARITRELEEGYRMDGQFLLMGLLWHKNNLDAVYGPLRGFIINVISKTKDVGLKRLTVDISPRDYQRFEKTMAPVIVELHKRLETEKEDEDKWAMNFGVCKNPKGYGPCEYLDLCLSHGSLERLYTIGKK